MVLAYKAMLEIATRGDRILWCYSRAIRIEGESDTLLGSMPRKSMPNGLGMSCVCVFAVRIYYSCTQVL